MVNFLAWQFADAKLTSLHTDTLDNFCPSCNKVFVLEDRVEKLETLAAEQERTIEELSSVIARQWAEIETLSKKLDLLTKQIAVLEERTGAETPEPPPPHY